MDEADRVNLLDGGKWGPMASNDRLGVSVCGRVRYEIPAERVEAILAAIRQEIREERELERQLIAATAMQRAA